MGWARKHLGIEDIAWWLSNNNKKASSLSYCHIGKILLKDDSTYLDVGHNSCEILKWPEMSIIFVTAVKCLKYGKYGIMHTFMRLRVFQCIFLYISACVCVCISVCLCLYICPCVKSSGWCNPWTTRSRQKTIAAEESRESSDSGGGGWNRGKDKNYLGAGLKAWVAKTAAENWGSVKTWRAATGQQTQLHTHSIAKFSK